jgi:hypothetical protein
MVAYSREEFKMVVAFLVEPDSHHAFSALSDEVPVHSREKRMARSRTSLQEI